MPRLQPAQIDRHGDLAAALAQYKPMLLVDASGPFQGSTYGVPQACIAARVPYLDLADGREFVAGIDALDVAAKAAGVAIIAGASSVPALSGAVVRHLVAGMDSVNAIEMAISASNRATAGRSVEAAILGYVGKPIRLWRAGRWTTGFGWQDMRREQFDLANGVSLGNRLVALADVPDLGLLPERVVGRPAVTFRAGTELAAGNIALWLASWPVRWGWLSSLGGFAGLLGRCQRLTSAFGSDKSGMVVRLFGRVADARIERRWTLIAGDGHGPEIPTLAAAILADRIVAGAVLAGARDAGEELALADFEALFQSLSIRHETRDIGKGPPLCARIIATCFADLPRPVAAMHDVLRDSGATGEAHVTRGRNPFARIIAKILGFPREGFHALHVAFSERDGVERWTRDFAGTHFSSELSQNSEMLVERFGLLRFYFELTSQTDGLCMILRRWSLAAMPLPLAFAPRVSAREWAELDRFHFDIAIAMSGIGDIVRYRGTLSPCAP